MLRSWHRWQRNQDARSRSGLPRCSKRQSFLRPQLELLESRHLLAVASTTLLSASMNPVPTLIDYSGGFAGASTLSTNGSAAISGSRLRLTNGGVNQAASVYYTTPVNIANFSTQFRFQLTSPTAEGFTFIIQRAGLGWLGSSRSGLGYAGIPQSEAIKFDLFNDGGGETSGNSTGFYQGGAAPTTPETDLSPLDLHSGDVFQVNITYDGVTLRSTILDTTTGASASQTYNNVNIPNDTYGNWGYVGFTASTGSGTRTATQDILNWTYSNYPVASPSVYGQAVYLTATVNPTGPGTTVPTGTVTFMDGATTLGTSTLSSGVATLNTSTLAVGSHTLTAVYGGDTNYTGSTSTAATQTVNQASTFTAITSSTASASVRQINFAGGFSGASGLTLNGSAVINGSALQLTDGATFAQAGSVFYNTQVDVTSFATQFQFQFPNNPNADGMTFTLQGIGTTALGASGGGLGYQGIGSSMAVKFSFFSSNGMGFNSTGLYTNGADPRSPSVVMDNTAVRLLSGHVFQANLTYDGTTLVVTVTDTVTAAKASQSYVVNIPGTIGSNTAYAGFTGGDGNFYSVQNVLNWTYDRIPLTATSTYGQPLTFTATVNSFAPGAPQDIYNNFGEPGDTFNTSGADAVNNSQWIARSFIVPAGSGYRLTSVTMGLDQSTAGAFAPRVFTDNGGMPGSNIGATFGSPSPAISGSPTAITFNATSTTNLTGGTKYWIIASATSGSFGWYNHQPTISRFFVSNNQGASWWEPGASPFNEDSYKVDGIPLASITGTVTFKDGVTTLGTAAVSGGTATLTTSTLNAGSHTITAIYNGDSNFTTSTSGNFMQTVNPASTTTVTVLNGAPINYSAGFTGGNLTLNGATAALVGSTLQLTNGSGNEISTAYYNTPVNVTAFTTQFQFRLGNPSTRGGGNGMTFVIQNAGLNAVGSNGGRGLGYQTISPSVAVAWNKCIIYDPVTGICSGSYTNQYSGGQDPNSPPGTDLTLSGVDLHNGDLMQVNITYDGTTLFVTTKDTVTNASATQSYTVNIPSLVSGSTAYVGFTAADGWSTVTANIFNWTYSNSTDAPTVYGQPATFTATVNPGPPATGTPTGTVTFKDGVTTLGTGTLSGGVATYTTSSLSVASHTVTAVYGGDSNFTTSTSAGLTHTVNQASTTTALVSSVNPSVWGQSTTFTATVTAVSPGAGTPTGTVTFKDGATILGTGTLTGGVATLSTSSLATGSHTIAAVYSGDGNFTTSTSSSLTQTVNQASSSTIVSSSVNPSAFGQSVTLTATVSAVSPGAGTPTGTVTFKDGATTLGTGTLSGGSATYTTSALALGNHTVTAVYGGDSNFTTSTSASLTQSVEQASTTTVTSSVNPSVFGQAVTFTATVSGAGGTPTGTVTFKDGATTLGTATLSSGTASYATSSLAVGGHAITVVYGGDSNFTTSTSSNLTETVNQSSTATTLVTSGSPSIYGQAVTFTATVSALAPGAGTPTGTVTFTIDGVAQAPVTLNGSAQATLSTSTLSVASHTVTAAYNGDANFTGTINPSIIYSNFTPAGGSGFNLGAANGVNSSLWFAGGFTVPSTSDYQVTKVTLALDFATAGTFTPRILKDSGGSGPATGAGSDTGVLFGAPSPAIPSSGSSPAACTFTATNTVTLTKGTKYWMVASVPSGNSGVYAWWENNSGASSIGYVSFDDGSSWSSVAGNEDAYRVEGATTAVSLTQTVNKANTTTTVASSANPSVFGQSVTFTATVSAVSPGAGTPTGSVTFTIDGVAQAPVSLNGSAQATLSTSSLTVGTHTVTASYSGDGNFNTSSSSSFIQTVNQASSTTSVTSSVNPSVFGQSVTFTATVAAVSPGAGTPTGTVSFKDGSTTLGTGTLSSGSATFATSTLSVGSHTITAVYAGDPNFSTSTSSSLAQTVNQAGSTTSVTSSVSPSVFGQLVTFTATVGAVSPGSGTPTGTVTFKDGATTLGTSTLSGGTATYGTSALTVGTHGITAVYGGDANYTGSASPSTTQTVNQASTATALTSSGTGASVRQIDFSGGFAGASSLALNGSAIVSGSALQLTDGVASGQAGSAFYNTRVDVSSFTTQFTFQTTAGSNTADGFTFTIQNSGPTALGLSGGDLGYGPDWTGAGGIANSVAIKFDLFNNQGEGPNSTGLYKNGVAPMNVGSIDLTGTGIDLHSGDVFQANMTYDGTRLLVTLTDTVTGAQATQSYMVNIPAIVNGTTAYAGFTGGDGAVLSRQRILTWTYDSAPLTATSTYGQAVTFTATVNPLTPGAGTRTGTVTFKDGTTTLGTSTLSGGIATYTTSALTVGNHAITAVYNGDSSFTTSTSWIFTHTVNPSSTSTVVTSSLNPSIYGQGVIFTATVSAVVPGAGTPTGTVTFKDGNVALGTGTLSGGIATYATSALTVGNHTITAVYNGDSNFTASTSGSFTQTVNPSSTSTTLASSVSPSLYGQLVTFTASVSAVAPGGGTPTGIVTFKDGTIALGTGTLSGGIATYTTSALTAGNHTITAVYNGDSNFATSTSGTFTQAINQSSTSTTLASSVNPTSYGQLVTFTASVSALAPGGGTATGTVTFKDGAIALGIGTLSGGIATYVTSGLAVGNHTITAVYAGDANFTGSTSGNLTQTINQASSGTTVTSSANPSVVGQSVTFTATVTAVGPGSGTPTGTVTFMDGALTLATSTLSGGAARYTTSALAVASHTITAIYSGDGNFGSSTSPNYSQAVNQASSTTTVTADINPSVYGQTLTFTATVSATRPGAGVPTGIVTFKDGLTILGSGTLNSGKATYTTSALAVGSHNITAVYGGDTNFTASTSANLAQTVNRASSTTTVASSVNPSAFGRVITLTAMVSIPYGDVTPTGTVTFMDGATTLGSATLSGGTATYTTSALAVGSHTITAVYSDETEFTPSTSTTLLQTVNPASTVIVVTCSVPNSVYGQAVTFSAAVSALPPGAGVPSGTVTFKDGSTTLGTATLNDGVATFSTSSLASGTHAIWGIYNGAINFSGSSAFGYNQVVTQAATSVAVTSSVDGPAVTLTVTVSALPPSGSTPTGTIALMDGSTVLWSGALVGGTAVFSTTALLAGSHTITAVYGGQSNFNTALERMNLTINSPGTGSPVTPSLTPGAIQQAVLLTSTLNAPAAQVASPTNGGPRPDASPFQASSSILNNAALATSRARHGAVDGSAGQPSGSSTVDLDTAENKPLPNINTAKDSTNSANNSKTRESQVTEPPSQAPVESKTDTAQASLPYGPVPSTTIPVPSLNPARIADAAFQALDQAQPFRTEWLRKELDVLRQQMDSDATFRLSDAIVEFGLTAATIGYVAWNIKNFYWIASALTTTPLWRQAFMDPLAVLEFWEKHSKKWKASAGLGWDDEEEERLKPVLG